MNVDECCAVCMEPLEWTGIGTCGHKETCSKCVARWRFVLKDTHCMVCKTPAPAVLFTRFMGDFTARLTPEQFVELPKRAGRGEVHLLPDIQAYFDDVNHYQQIRQLCGYTHPAVESKCKEQQKEVPRFASADGLRKWVDMHCKQQFCDICIQGRKVFLCEQLLYSKAELDRHLKTGDETGPLAESGFKGHPSCSFCRTRFYDSQDLYKHMESSHEHCFLCRRQQPGQYEYFRTYRELEEHFRRKHFPCPHPDCLEKKFVVFGAEHEMKHHFATEHGDELKMSRAQRREASTIPINLTYREGAPGQHPAHDPLLDLARPGVVIGGGDNVTSRHGRRGGASGMTGLMRHSRSEGTMASHSDRDVGPAPEADSTMASVTFNAGDFPSISGNGRSTANVFTGLWGGGAGTGGASTSAGASASGLSTEHFPSLPSMSKAAKKKLRQQGGNVIGSSMALAEQLRQANRPVRVISRATPRQQLPSHAHGITPQGRPSASTTHGSRGTDADGADDETDEYEECDEAGMPISEPASSSAALATRNPHPRQPHHLPGSDGWNTIPSRPGVRHSPHPSDPSLATSSSPQPAAGATRGAAAGGAHLAPASSMSSHASASSFQPLQAGSWASSSTPNLAALAATSHTAAMASAAAPAAAAGSTSFADAFPALPAGTPAPHPPPSFSHSHATTASVAASALPAAAAASGNMTERATGGMQAPAPPLTPAEFPALGDASGSGAGASSLPPPASAPRYTLAAAREGRGGEPAGHGAGSGLTRSLGPTTPPVVMRADDFPSLGQVAVAARAAPATRPKSAAAHAAASPAPAHRPTTAAPPASLRNAAPGTDAHPSSSSPATQSATAISAVPLGGVSSSLKAANRALVDKIQAQLADEGRFAQFKAESGCFMRGEVAAAAYHTRLLELGLLGLTAELAALLPVPERRDALLATHKAYLASPAATGGPSAAGARGRAGQPGLAALPKGWVPPEAALAAAYAAEQQASWACKTCTLVNAPGMAVCEACGQPAGGIAAPANPFPSLSAAYGGLPAAASSSQGHGNAANGGASTSGLGADAGTSAPAEAKAGKSGKAAATTKYTIGLGAGTARQAVAAQRQALANTGSSKSAWSQSGGAKLAKKFGALNDAWGE